jgi:hypothetical protein
MLKGIILKNLIEVGLVPGLGVIISASAEVEIGCINMKFIKQDNFFKG